MNLPFREIVDLGHEVFSGMPNSGGAPGQFWPTSDHALPSPGLLFATPNSNEGQET